jgi:error-prone DNA polymerase
MLAGQHGHRLLASNEVLASRARSPLQDIMTCIREHCTLVDAGSRLQPNAERHLKSPLKCNACSSSGPVTPRAEEVAVTIARSERVVV